MRPVSILPPVVAVLAFGVALASPLGLLADADSYWHIAAGEWVLRHLAVPHHDPFSSTMAGAPWVDHEWLSEVLMALAYHVGGWTAVVLLPALGVALALGLLMRDLGRWLTPVPATVLVVLAAASIAPGLLARPHLMALPVMEIWCAALIVARSQSRPPSWMLLPLMALWANLHGSFALGFVVAGPLAVEAMIEAQAARRRVALQWGLFLAGALVAACLTPNGVQGLVHPVRMMRMPVMLAAISEWASPDFHHLQPIEIWVVAALGFALWRGARLPACRLLLLLCLLHAGLLHARNQLLLGVVGALVVAEPLGACLRQRDPAQRSGLPAWPAQLGAGIAALLITAHLLLHPVLRVDDRVTPMAALDHVPSALVRQPVFNDYDFGGYLIFEGVRPFIDGRADMYGDAFMTAYLDAMRPEKAKLERALWNHAVTWTLLKPDDGAVALLDSLPGWQRVYGDSIAVVHVRSDALAALRVTAVSR